MNSPAATVFVIDDDAAIRDLLKLLLKTEGLAVQVCPSAQDFLSSYDSRQPGCLLLDVNMPGMTGLELQQQLNLLGAIIPVIFITGSADVPMAVEAMQQGAFDFLQKPFKGPDVLERVRRALERDGSNRAQIKQVEAIRGRMDSLTPREHEVLERMVGGAANKVIAAELGLSQRTVEIHRSRVMEKMEANSLAQLVRMFMNAQGARPASPAP